MSEVLTNSPREKLREDIKHIREHLRELGIQLMELQQPCEEPRMSVLSALEHIKYADDASWRLS